MWRLFLLLASYYFYLVWDFRFLLILIGVSVFNFFSSLVICRNFLGRKKIFLFFSVIANLSVLVIFKYYEFFRFSFESLFFRVGFPINFPLLEIILPIGLSFYIFRVISYNADVYSGKIAEIPPFFDVLLYIAFFPQILAGPIMRAPEFLSQLKNGGAKAIEDIWESFSFIILGLFKKIVISSYLVLSITDDVFAVPENHSRLVLLLAVFAYSIVIYFDFSAYSDMSIGFAGLLGFKSPVNFDRPYLSKSIAEFWRRWHITLSSWFKDYVYIPLGGNRKGPLGKYLNLVIVMTLAGLWHGASINFVIWGLLNGLGLVVVHIYHDYKKRKNLQLIENNNFVKKFFSWLATFIFVSFTWIFFRSSTIGSAITFIKTIFVPIKNTESIQLYVLLVLFIGFLLFVFEKQIFKGLKFIQERLPVPFATIFIILVVILIFKLGPDTVPAFIYFGF
ncbi:MAG: MBOAT family O-acyltransferase [Candidatus Gracilibacteria bacterium]